MGFWLWGAAAFAAGLLGSMGLGGGGILLLCLTLSGVPQLTAQSINLIFIIPVGVTGLILHRKNGLAPPAVTLPVILGGLPGAVAGCLLGAAVGGERLSAVYGGFVALVGAREVLIGVKALIAGRGAGETGKAG